MPCALLAGCLARILGIVAVLTSVPTVAETQSSVKNLDPQGAVPASSIRMPEIQGVKERPVAAIYCDCEGLSTVPPRAVRRGVSALVVVWADGKVLWSKNRVSGGPPYFRGCVPCELVTHVIARVERPEAGVKFVYIPYRPGGCMVRIAVDTPSKAFSTFSQHELFHDTFNSGGDALTEKSESLEVTGDSAIRQFRENWRNTKECILSVIPAQGERIGNVHFVLRWSAPADKAACPPMERPRKGGRHCD